MIFNRERVIVTRHRVNITLGRVFFRERVIFTPFEGEFYPSQG